MIRESSSAGAPEIEITDEMVRAGVGAIEPFELRDIGEGWGSEENLVRKVFLAMLRSSAKQT